MGKIKRITKSRKDHVCGKCRRQIPKGSPYLKGLIRFAPEVIRCTACGLKWYEVTTSDYIRNVGAIVEDWQENFEIQDGVWEEISSNLEEFLNQCSESLENMPEQLQESENGQLLQERIDSLEEAIDDLGNCSMEDFLKEGIENLDEEDLELLKAEGDTEDPEGWYLTFWEKGSDLAQRWQEKTEEAIIDCICTILEEVPV